MPFFDTDKERAALIVLLLAVGVFYALMPYATGSSARPCCTCFSLPLISGSREGSVRAPPRSS